MRTKLTSFAVLLLAMAAAAGLLAVLDRSTPGGPLPTPTPPPAPVLRTPSPVLVKPNRRQSVVLVSIAGAGADALSDWLANGDMPTLSHLADRGWLAPLRSKFPLLPSLALTTLATGSTSPDAEPIWQTAARHHRITALLFWPSADPDLPDRRADYTLSCVPPATASGRQTVTLSPADLWAGASASFSPPYEGRLTFSSPAGVVRWHLLAVDTIDDDKVAYDIFYVAPHGDGTPAVGRNTKQLTLGEWVTLPISGPGLMLTITGQRTLTSTGMLSSAVGVTATATLTPTATITPTAVPEPLLELTLYQVGVQPVVARPAVLSQEVIERFGFCPPLPDPATVAQGQLPAAAFQELAVRRARWTLGVAAYVFERYRPHLMVVRQEVLSASEQALLLTNPRQLGYSSTRVADFEGHRRSVARAIDGGLDALLAAVDLNYASVLIASEYGMAPVHTQVNVPIALQSVWEQLKQLNNDLLRGDPPPHVYVDGAFLSIEIGSGWDEAYDVAIDTIRRALAGLADPKTGNPVFAQVTRRGDAGAWAASWPYPGDILAQSALGYVPSAMPGTAEVFSEAQVYGQMDCATSLSAKQGTLVVVGWGVSEEETRGVVWLEDVASMASALLGIPTPADHD